MKRSPNERRTTLNSEKRAKRPKQVENETFRDNVALNFVSPAPISRFQPVDVKKKNGNKKRREEGARKFRANFFGLVKQVRANWPESSCSGGEGHRVR